MNRLSKYLLGVLIGLGLTWVLFEQRGCSWLPNNVIKDDIYKKGVVLTEDVACKMQCNEIDYKSVKEVIASGDVNYSESGPRENPRWYQIESEGIVQSIIVVLTDTTSTITDVNLLKNKDCDC